MTNAFQARTGAELQAARKAAAERYFRIATDLTPDHVLVTYRRSLSGRAWGPDTVWGGRIEAPEPTTRRRLQIYLHEVAHLVLGHCGNNRKPKHVKEMEAEKWSFDQMRAAGVAVPRKSIKRAKQHVARKIRQARRRGAKRIDPAAARFAG